MNIFDKADIKSLLDAKLKSNEILAYRYELNKLFLKIPKADSVGLRMKKKNWFDFEFDVTNIGGKELHGLLLKKISANSADQLKECWKRELREVKIKNITR